MNFSDSEINKIEMLYSLYSRNMLTEAYRILKDECYAEDAVQQAFIKIMNNLNRIDLNNINSTKKFLIIITRNVAIDIYNSRKNVLSNSEYIDAVDQEDAELFAISKSPCDELLEKEKCSRIMNAINDLNPIYRDVIMLERIYGYSRKDIATLLNINYDTVKKRSERARALLDEALRKEKECL